MPYRYSSQEKAYSNIPIFHMEAGNRCFDQKAPEETNRKIVDHTSDIKLTYSDIAREYLLRERLPADRIIKTGSPMFEVINSRKDDIEKSYVLQRLNLKEGQYVVVSSYREENISFEVNFFNLIDSLNSVSEKYNMPIIVSTHPRARKMIDSKEIEINPLITFMKPLGFNDYVKLQTKAKTVLSDS
jgi:UDP-N-acetylglucosamine 2-epimerase